MEYCQEFECNICLQLLAKLLHIYCNHFLRAVKYKVALGHSGMTRESRSKSVITKGLIRISVRLGTSEDILFA
jgi:hypothetical protein